MAQCPTVMAFRKRLKSYGYSDIRIFKELYSHVLYEVRAVEPLGNKLIVVKLSLVQMDHLFR
jgi:hypothetical protein